MKWLRWWWPVLLWAALIAIFSTDAFSGEHTSRVILPVLRWLFPHAAPHTLALAHHYIRKAGHVTEYFVLGLLLVRGIRSGRNGWRMEWAVAAVAVAAAWAGLDELHQAFVPSRGPSMLDVMIDVTGAAAGQLAFAATALVRSRGMQSGQDAPVDSPDLRV
jgi:VanZ family protein